MQILCIREWIDEVKLLIGGGDGKFDEAIPLKYLLEDLSRSLQDYYINIRKRRSNVTAEKCSRCRGFRNR